MALSSIYSNSMSDVNTTIHHLPQIMSYSSCGISHISPVLLLPGRRSSSPYCGSRRRWCSSTTRGTRRAHTEIRVRLLSSRNPLPTEEADANHDQPTRRASKAPHQPAEGNKYAILVKRSVDRVQDAIVFGSVEIGLVSDNLDNVFASNGRGVKLDYVHAGWGCLGGWGGGLLWELEVPNAWETGGKCGAQNFLDFAV